MNVPLLVFGFSFFIMGFVHGYVILWLNGYVSRKRLRIPNLWCFHSAWGIAWVVLSLRLSGIISDDATMALAVTFLAAFPGIYIANHIQWLRQNKKKFPRIRPLETIFGNGQHKKTS